MTTLHTCPGCGNGYSHESSASPYCSHDCRRRHEPKTPVKTIKGYQPPIIRKPARQNWKPS